MFYFMFYYILRLGPEVNKNPVRTFSDIIIYVYFIIVLLLILFGPFFYEETKEITGRNFYFKNWIYELIVLLIIIDIIEWFII